MPSVTLEVGALVIVLVERDAQPVVVEVDRPVQVLDLRKISSIPTNPMAYLLLPFRTVISLSFFIDSCRGRSGWLTLSHGPPLFLPPPSQLIFASMNSEA